MALEQLMRDALLCGHPRTESVELEGYE